MAASRLVAGRLVAGRLIAVLLAIELLDELVYGARETAWPLLRHDLGLTYATIGVLLALPRVSGALIEPWVGLLADAGHRRALVVGGGVLFAGALLLMAAAWNVAALLVAFALLSPASGAFVSLSQATLMDLDPAGRERNMARWTLAGSVGVVAGPLLLAGAVATGAGWRPVFLGLALLSMALTGLARRTPASRHGRRSVSGGARAAFAALRRASVVRWLVVLEAGDFMGDVLNGYIALYLVDVVDVAPVQAGLGVIAIAVAGLAGDALLLPVLRRVEGLTYLRLSVLTMLAVYPALLLLPGFGLKLVILAAIGVLRAGWYAIPQARLYDEIPEASGLMLVLSNAGSLAASSLPLAFGALAQAAGFGAAMWLLLLGPLVVLILARDDRSGGGAASETASGRAEQG